MSQVGFENALSRVGMQACGGNLIDIPWSTAAGNKPAGNVVWAGRDMGLFVIDWTESETVDLEALARKDVVVCSAVLNQDGAWTNFAVGDSHFDANGVDMTMVFVPQYERFRFATRIPRGLKAVTVVVDIMSMMRARGLQPEVLPKSLRRLIAARQVSMETLAPGHFGEIAREVAGRRAMFPSLAAFYYEGKTFELVSALLSELARRDAFGGDGVFDRRMLEQLSAVKRIIDCAPHRTLDVDDLARVSAMNRTKLRSAFKRAYGMTLSGYRTTLLLQRADRALKQEGASVKQAARRAGYATTSGFIIAYKRQYGVCPGGVAQEGC